MDEFRDKVKKMLNQNIRFDGHINKIINSINENKKEIILKWMKECKEEIQEPKNCKNYDNLIAFIYKSNDNKIRGILTKIKNSYFLELFLDKHKYYDRKRKYLGL